jgi:hypothetical protein
MDLDVPKLKCAYKLERDVHVVALAPLSKPFQNASKQLYVCTYTKP